MVDGNPEHTVGIGSHLDQVTRDQLTSFLLENSNVFAWAPMDMLGIDLSVMVDHLKVDPKYQSFKQKKWSFMLELQKAITKEVDKLLDTDFIWKLPIWNGSPT